MRITISTKLDAKQDMLVLGLFEEDKSHYRLYNKELSKELDDAVKRKTFSKKFGESYSTRISALPFRKVIVLGFGKKKEMTLERVRCLSGKAVSFTKAACLNGFTTNMVKLVAPIFNDELLGRAAAEGLLLADYAFIKYLGKEKKEKKKKLSAVSLVFGKSKKNFVRGLQTGRAIAGAANLVRDWVNEPAGVATSLFMEKQARKIAAANSKVRLRVLNKPEMLRLGMGALLGVNAGSNKPPKLIFVEYRGASAKDKFTAFVGKGITFDSGGYNLKPTKYIEDMKMDMGGAAAVLGTIKAAAQLGLKKNLVGVMALCENMVSGTAQRPGDIVKAYNGKTIEIGNTDAEGRLVLADALSYTEKKYKPSVIIDLATLTGACVVALGYYTAAVMGKDEKLIAALQQAGKESGDRVWPLPFFEKYQDWMDGSISDLNNISQKGKGYEAGSVTAGVFLSKFVDLEKTRWAHLDIAGSAYWGVEGDYFEKGATGSGVRVLSYYLLNKNDKS